MLSFAYPAILWLLLILPLFLLLYMLSRYARKRKLKAFGNLSIVGGLMPLVSPYKPVIKITLELLSVALLVIAFARPWGGLKDQNTKKEGIEVIIAVDVSNSMLASSTSAPDGPERMRTAKMMLEKLINRLDNDRVGLIVYAGDAYTLIPVTNDYVSAKMFLNSIDPTQISNQGTNISAALNMAAKAFSNDKNIGKSIILITDADELENPAGVSEAAKALAKNNVQINVVGVGSSTPVPVKLKSGYMIDPTTGTDVMTGLNEDLAAEIARDGKGIYVNASNKDALNELIKQLSTVKKSALESSVYALHDELFPIFVWIALALVVLNIFVLDRKIGWLDKITFFKKDDKKRINF